MKKKVIPAVARKMAFFLETGETLFIQCDGASPHTGKDTIEGLNRWCAGGRSPAKYNNIQVIQQPARSPVHHQRSQSPFVIAFASRVRRFSLLRITFLAIRIR